MLAKRLIKFKECTVLRRLDSIVKCSNLNYSEIASAFSKSLRKKKVNIDSRFLKQLHIGTAKVNNIPYENNYARSILNVSEAYSNCLATPLPIKKELEDSTFTSLMKKTWINMKNDEILENFELISYHILNSKGLLASNYRYNGILELITSRISSFSDNDLQHLLKCLELWNKKLTNYGSNPALHNFLKCLDNECIKRLSHWSTCEVLLINDLWCKIKCAKFLNFVIKSLTEIDHYKMTPSNLVHYAYLLKINNKMPVNLSSFQQCVENHIDQMSVEEAGIISMAFFKYQIVVKSKNLILMLMQKLQNNIDNVSEIALTATLKILRNSIDLQIVQQYDILQKALVPRIPQCTVISLTHIAHMQARTLLYNHELTSMILERYRNEIKTARLKDIERILFTLYIFNFNPKTTDFYAAAYEELLSPNRVLEINEFPKSLIYSILFMLQVNYYPKQILESVMRQEFLMKICNGNISNLHREYLVLDYCIELEHPEYTGPRLRKDILHFLTKRFGAQGKSLITEKQQVNQYQKLMVDVIHTCKNVLGSDTFVYVDALLPHFNKTDVILCYDPEKKDFVSEFHEISKVPCGSIKRAPKDGKKWYVLVIGTHNNMTRNTEKPTGILAVQLRHLERIGYTPIVIPNFQWKGLANEWKKKKYIQQIISKIL